jgi:hypothetical protein
MAEPMTDAGVVVRSAGGPEVLRRTPWLRDAG